MPIYEVEDPNTGTIVELEGDAPPTEQELEEIFSQLPQQPGGVVGETLGALETVGTIASGALAEPVSGLVGLASMPFVGAEKAADVVTGTQKTMTLTPSTPEGQRNIAKIGKFLGPINDLLEKAKEISGETGYDLAGPIGGAIGATIPEALLELIPAFAGTKSGAKAIGKQAAKTGKQAAKLTDEAADLRKALTTDTGDLSKAGKIVSKGKEGDIVELIAPDPDFYKAADKLGISAEPLASYASKNPQFRSIEQGLAAIPGNMLDPKGKAFVAELSQKADDLITEYGGSLDKVGVSEAFKASALQTIDDLAAQADDLYTAIGDALPKRTRVTADNTVKLLSDIDADLGGRLSTDFRAILDELSDSPTHGLLDQRRKDIGQAIYKKSGPFKNAETGQLKRIYAAMTSDQDIIADSFGMKDTSKTAKALVAQRKQLEDNLVKLLGKDLSGSITTKLGRAVKRLGKGDFAEFDKIMKAAPEAAKTELVLTALNDVFRGTGAGKNALDVTQFSKFMDELNRQPMLKSKLYKEIPTESRNAIENLYKVSKGVSTALQDKIPTGRVAALFDENNGMLRRLMGSGAEFVAGRVAGGGALGTAAGAVVGDFLRQSSGRAKTTADLLATPQFQNMIKQAVTEGVIDGGLISRKLAAAEKALQKSEKYQRWANTLDKSASAKLATMGIAAYLLGEDE